MLTRTRAAATLAALTAAGCAVAMTNASAEAAKPTKPRASANVAWA